MNKPKALFITRSSEQGGEARFIEKLSKNIRDKFEIKTISLLDSKKSLENKNKIFLKPTFIFKKPLISIKDMYIIKKEIKSADLSQHFIFDFYSIIFFFLCFFYNKKAIVTFHTNLKGGKRGRYLFDFILKILTINIFVIFASKLIFLTKSQMSNFKKFCLFKNKFNKGSSFAYNFIDSDIMLARKKHLDKQSRIIFIGRLTKAKGTNELINLIECSYFADVSFTIIGEGNLKNSVPTKSNVMCFDKIDNNEIFSYYDKSNIFILPSYSEVFPMTILEAMARGLVILVSDIPGMREIIKEGRNGYLFPPGDVGKMKELVLYLKNNPKEIERISKNNLKDIWKFTAEKQVPEYIKVYKEVLKEK